MIDLKYLEKVATDYKNPIKQLNNAQLEIELEERTRYHHPQIEWGKVSEHRKNEPNRTASYIPPIAALGTGILANAGLKRLGLDFGRTTLAIGAGLAGTALGIEAMKKIRDLDPEHKGWSKKYNELYNSAENADIRYRNKMYEHLGKNKDIQNLAKQRNIDPYVVQPELDKFRTLNTIENAVNQAKVYADKNYNKN